MVDLVSHFVVAHDRVRGRARSGRAHRGVAAAFAACLSVVLVAVPGPHTSAAQAAEVAVAISAVPSSGIAPLVVVFGATSADDAAAWAWTFGDGGASAARLPSHTFMTPGTYPISLVVTRADGSTVLVSGPVVRVDAAPPAPMPVAAFDVSGGAHVAGRAVTFVDRSSGDPTAWAWSFGDGASSTIQSPVHLFASAGTYAVTLSVSKATLQSTASRSVLVIARWTGRINLFRSGAFSTQATYTWCVPASAQTMTNIISGRSRHSVAEQRAWYAIGRRMDRYRYSYPGVDPQGWVGILNRAGVGPYRVIMDTSFAASLKHAAQRIRLTGKPVGLFVGAGSHAWVLSGFSATADPAVTNGYTVVSVYVMGPLWPKQVSALGYFDLAPNTRLSSRTLSRILTPYHDRIRTVWEGHYTIVAP